MQLRQRLFTNEFNKGDRVSIIRSDQGWFDGSVVGTITTIHEIFCVVLDDDGFEHKIKHCRDISHC